MLENSLCSDIGHHSFLAAASALNRIQKGPRSITLAALFASKKAVHVRTAIFLVCRIVFAGSGYRLTLRNCFWPSWRRDAIGNALTLHIARSFLFFPWSRVASRGARTIIVPEVYPNQYVVVNGK